MLLVLKTKNIVVNDNIEVLHLETDVSDNNISGVYALGF